MSHPATGIYCLAGLAAANNVVGSIGTQNALAFGMDVELAAASGCGAGTQVTIRTFDVNGAFVNDDFFVNIN